MAVTVECPADREQFLQVVLADPDLLDQAFAVVVACWEVGPPPAPPTARVGPPTAYHRPVDSSPLSGGGVRRWPARRDRTTIHLPRSPPEPRLTQATGRPPRSLLNPHE
jgi:hypothetical protein